MSAVLVAAVVVVVVTSAVHGAVGFGMNLLAVPVLVLLDPAFVPGPAVAAGLVLSALVALRERTPIDRSLGWAVLGLLPGTGAALLVLSVVPSTSLSLPMGLLVLVGVGLSVVHWRPRPSRGTLATAGVASGFLATAASVGGPPLALVYADAPGARLRSNLATFFVVTAVVSLAALCATGHFGAAELRTSAVLLPGVVVGYVASGPLRPWVDHGRARPLVLGLSAVAGLAAVVNGLSSW